MKTVLLISIAFLLQLDLFGQTLEGTFTADKEYFAISKDSIKFEIETVSAFRVITRGIGKYELIENFLIIKTSKYPGIKSRVIDSTHTDSDIINVHVGKLKLIPNILGKDINGEMVKAYKLDENGVFSILPKDNIATIEFSTLSHDPLTTQFNKGFNYRVEIAEGVTIENQNVVFVVNENSNNSIGLTLLDIKAEDKEITSAKKLYKLKRKKGKYTFWTQSLTRK
ncbi:MAG: hypothetical protein HKN75_04465 [Bacteroidia bacterium]|nr:hypothetical protein [Bacteroidia bacterium]